MPQLSGHETFPMRYGWLKKAYDAVQETRDLDENHSIFNDVSAIARFGVGKNMVASIRHWATQCDVIQSGRKGAAAEPGFVGDKIFAEGGMDPFMENPSTLWLLHWKLASNPHLTTWFWVFNHFSGDHFERDTLVSALVKLGQERNWSRVTPSTIKRDVDCFVRTYVAKPATNKQTHEDTMESPLTELSLIKPIGKKDGFRIIRGPKVTLGDGIFTFALIDFWAKSTSANTLSFEAIAHKPGSPGKVFQLSEDDLVDRLSRIDAFTHGGIRWSETAGLKQLVRSKPPSDIDISFYLAEDYSTEHQGARGQ
ncbi:DUF4007 family protein [Marinospirillum celere]|uniref:DUF4007 family protein n=1 Tax=Marinospirillum celere TaxID=1122252 RepID=UPI001C42EC82|nr:DUF4007 family protein [Marinospirillum celere]